LILLEITAEQRRAVEAPYAHCHAILGAAGTGKSTALAERVARLRAIDPEAEPLILSSCGAIETYAIELLRSQGLEVTLVDDVEAEFAFAATCSSLFELRWD
jgi:hypothetical protein